MNLARTCKTVEADRAVSFGGECARSIRDQCAGAGVPFFFKQRGAWAPGENALSAPTRTEQTATWFNERWIFESLTPAVSSETHVDDEPDLYRLGKKAAGRMLDGVEHNGMPELREVLAL